MFVLSDLGMGGMQSQLASLLETPVAQRERWRVTLLALTTERDAELARRLELSGASFLLVDRRATSFPLFLWRLVTTIRRERPDIVHTLLAGSSGTWGRMAARMAGVPALIHSDRSLDPILTRVHRLVAPLLDRGTDAFFTNAHAVARRLEASGVPADKISLVPNGVDLDRFGTANGERLRSDWGVAGTDTVVGFLGMLRSEKRPQLLLEAVALMRQEDLPARVVFAGDGVLLPPLRQQAADLGLDQRVLFLGQVDDASSFLAAIDILALTSDTEGLPNAVIEAMAAGKPVVATRVSDVPELVTDNGMVVEPRDAAGLAAALSALLRLPRQDLVALGAAGRTRAQQFGLAAAAGRFWDAHQRLLARRGP